MGKDEHTQRGAYEETKDCSDDKSNAHGATYWDEMNAALNHLFQESWIGYIVGGLAMVGVIYAAGSYFSVKPVWIGCISTIAIVDLFLFAAFKAMQSLVARCFYRGHSQ